MDGRVPITPFGAQFSPPISVVSVVDQGGSTFDWTFDAPVTWDGVTPIIAAMQIDATAGLNVGQISANVLEVIYASAVATDPWLFSGSTAGLIEGANITQPQSGTTT